jgi:cell division protein ZipA
LPEIRWILLGFGLLLLSGIWWWGTRRSSQAPGNAELRESSLKEPELKESRDWNQTAFEPVSMRTDHERTPVPDVPIVVDITPVAIHETGMRADFHSIPVLDEPPSAPPVLTKVTRNAAPVPAMPAPTAESFEATIEFEVPPPAAPKISDTSPIAVPSQAPPPIPRIVNVPPRKPAPPAPVATPSAENSDRIAVAPPAPNVSEKQKIVSIRVCAPGEQRWAGSALLAALEANGLAFGRYQVFHRRHIDGRSLFCVASLKEPGSFDVTQMPTQEFKGITLFAVLPGPIEALLTVDELLNAARDLAASLTGMLQDSKGVPLSPQRQAALRDDVARFQASLAIG